jgi:hypothetical protein
LVFFAVVGPLPFGRFAEVAAKLPGAHDNEIAAAAAAALRAVAALARGEESSFREHEERWRETIDRHGLSWLGATHQLAMGQVETSVGHPEQGEQRLREARATLAGFGDIWWCEAADATLCMAIGAQDRPREFLRLADALEQSALVPSRQIVIRRNIVQARALMLRGSAADASGIRCRSGVVPGFMIWLGDGADGFGLIIWLGRGDGAWPELAGWPEQRAAQVLREPQSV